MKAAAAVMLALSLAACQAPQAKPVASLPLQKQDFVHTVEADGVLTPMVQETLAAPDRTWGTLEMVLPEGQVVKKGTVVARISTREAAERMAQFSERMDNTRAELMKQRAQLPLTRMQQQTAVKDKARDAKIAQLDLQIAREGPRLNETVQAEVNLAVPELQSSAYPLAEKEELFKKGYLSEQELLTARQEYAQLQTQLQTARLALQQQSDAYRDPEIHAAELKARTAQLEAKIAQLDAQAQLGLERTRARNQGAQVQGFEKRIGRYQARLSGAEVRAPFDGVVLYPTIMGNQAPYIGMQVWGGLPLAQVARTSKLKVETRVNEFDIPQIKPGLSVTMTSPGFPGKVFAGKVTRVQKLAKFKDENKPVGLKYFDVEIELAQQAPELKANMTLAVAIRAETLKGAWTVPLEALHSKGEQPESRGESYYVRLDAQGKIEQRDVEVLARSRDFAAIKGNFTGSERVLLEPTGKGS